MSGVILIEGEARQPPDGRCLECGEVKDKFKPVMGGKEVCMNCGYQRKVE